MKTSKQRGSTMIDLASRNRKIKKVLGSRFGRGNVRVSSGRGSSYGWVDVFITATGDDLEHRAWRRKAMDMLNDNKVELYNYCTDDIGSGEGQTPMITIIFNDLELN